MGIKCTCDYWKGEYLCRKVRVDATKFFEHGEECALKQLLESGGFYLYRNHKSFFLKQAKSNVYENKNSDQINSRSGIV